MVEGPKVLKARSLLRLKTREKVSRSRHHQVPSVVVLSVGANDQILYWEITKTEDFSVPSKDGTSRNIMYRWFTIFFVAEAKVRRIIHMIVIKNLLRLRLRLAWTCWFMYLFQYVLLLSNVLRWMGQRIPNFWRYLIFQKSCYTTRQEL